MERFKMIASVYLLLIKDGNILLLRRSNTGYEDGKYGLPSGHVEDGESITHALVREVQEEIGMTLRPENVVLAHVMHRKEEDIRLDFFFVAKGWRQKPTNREPQKCDDMRWFPLNKLPHTTVGYVAFAIANYRNGITYAEIGWGTGIDKDR